MTIPNFPDDYLDALPRAFVRYYSAATVSFDWLRMSVLGQEHDAWLVPISDDISLGVGLDMEHSFVRVMRSMLDGWGVEPNDLLGRAVVNSIQGIDLQQFKDAGVTIVTNELAVPAMWMNPVAARKFVGGRAILVGATRKAACFIRRHDKRGAISLAERCLGALESGEWVESITPHEMCERDGVMSWQVRTWEELGVPPDLVQRLQRRYDFANYRRQQGALRSYLAAQGSQTNPVAAVLDRTSDGAEVSIARWTEGGGAQALPRVDVVLLFPKDGEPIPLNWAQVQANFGYLMEPMGLVPERYLVSEFPSPAALANLLS